MEQYFIYLAIGALSGIIFYFIMGREFLAKIYGSVIAGVIGGILGGNFLGNYVKIIEDFFNNKKVDFMAAVIGSIIFIWILKIVSQSLHHKD